MTWIKRRLPEGRQSAVVFGRRLTLFELLGFKVQVDASWIFLCFLVVWTLAAGVFPARHAGLSAATYWWMGVAGMIGLFFSLIFHELSHSIVARRFGMSIRGITLFVFGGVAEMEEEPPNPRSEFLMAIAGPIASFALAISFAAIGAGVAAAGAPEPVFGVARYLSLINTLLAAFNLVPAFPLDGGRALRASLWHFRRDLRAATRIASRIGEAFGFFLIALGVLNILAGNVVGGMWWCLIGLFVRGAAGASYYQVLSRGALEGEAVDNFMTSEPVTVSPEISVQELVEDYIYHYHYDFFPVTDGDDLIGCVNSRQVKKVPREQWPWRKVGEIFSPCSNENVIEAGSDALKALSLMSRTHGSRLMVTEDGRLVGIVALKDMLRFLALKIDLEGAS